jgi:hypothetical protein
MKTLIRTVRFIVWTVVLTLTATIGGVCLFGAYKTVRRAEWESFISILETIGLLFVLVVLMLVAGGFVLWCIREYVLPLGSDELKDKKVKSKQEE